MNTRQRQLILLIGFMTLLAVVILFTAVYAPENIKPSLDISLPEPLEKGINASVNGWDALISDLNSVGEAGKPAQDS